jgi:hypothetical protein
MQKLLNDFVGKFPRSKAVNTAMLVSVDSFSKFVWTIPVHEATARATVKVIKVKNILCLFCARNISFGQRTIFHFQRISTLCFEMGWNMSLLHPTIHSPRMLNDLTGTFERHLSFTISMLTILGTSNSRGCNWLSILLNTSQPSRRLSRLCSHLGLGLRYLIYEKWTNCCHSSGLKGNCSKSGPRLGKIFVRLGPILKIGITEIVFRSHLRYVTGFTIRITPSVTLGDT